ncbi:MAG TPA: hypothetical protein PLA50_17645, partial [Bacteroidia bacterium]|nr:hypothetical protein [Bacteroidia bacterium]
LATTGTPDGWERIADRVALFFEGGLLEVAPPDLLLSAPAFAYTREFFAGRPRLGDLARDLPTIGREAVREAEEAVGQSE